MGSGTQCVKWTMFIFNFLFFIMGCTILGIGIWLKVDKNDYVEISSYDYITAANLVIAAGVIIMLVTFFGCFGAAKESSALLLVFFIFMLIIFIMEIAAGGYAYAKRSDIEYDLSVEFRKSITVEYGEADHTGVTDAIDRFQRSFHCCGYDSYEDWVNSAYNKRTGTIPESCCIDENSPLCGARSASALKNYYTIGCYDEVEEFLKDNLIYVGAVAIAFAIIQILGMVFAMYLYCVFKNGGGTMA